MELRLSRRLRAVSFVLLTAAACGGGEDRPASAGTEYAPVEQSPQRAFWANLSAHCDRAFEGGLISRPETDRLFRGDEVMTAHFRECGPDEIRIPFHVEDNRSRTWILTWTDDGAGLDLRHDHRHEDGTPEENTMYGASTVDLGTHSRQEFIRETDSGVAAGWRIEILPGDRYTYGTIRDGEWVYRIDFDLNREVDPPPPPWGHG